MNKFIDLAICFGFLALVWWMMSSLIAEEQAARKLCEQKGGAYVTVRHSDAYCALKISLEE